MQTCGRVKMINCKLIILTAPPLSPGPGQGQMGWVHRLAFTRVLTLPVWPRLRQTRGTGTEQKTSILRAIWTFCAEDVCLFRYLFASCCQAAASGLLPPSQLCVTVLMTRHVPSLTPPFYPTLDTLSNLSLATRLTARADLGDLAASASARFCR